MECDGMTQQGDECSADKHTNRCDDVILSQFMDQHNVQRFLPKVRLTCIRNTLMSEEESVIEPLTRLSPSPNVTPARAEVGDGVKHREYFIENNNKETDGNIYEGAPDSVEKGGTETMHGNERHLQNTGKRKSSTHIEHLSSIAYKWSKLRHLTVSRSSHEKVQRFHPRTGIGRSPKTQSVVGHNPVKTPLLHNLSTGNAIFAPKRKRGRPPKNKQSLAKSNVHEQPTKDVLPARVPPLHEPPTSESVWMHIVAGHRGGSSIKNKHNARLHKPERTDKQCQYAVSSSMPENNKSERIRSHKLNNAAHVDEKAVATTPDEQEQAELKNNVPSSAVGHRSVPNHYNSRTSQRHKRVLKKCLIPSRNITSKHISVKRGSKAFAKRPDRVNDRIQLTSVELPMAKQGVPSLQNGEHTSEKEVAPLIKRKRGRPPKKNLDKSQSAKCHQSHKILSSQSSHRIDTEPHKDVVEHQELQGEDIYAFNDTDLSTKELQIPSLFLSETNTFCPIETSCATEKLCVTEDSKDIFNKQEWKENGKLELSNTDDTDMSPVTCLTPPSSNEHCVLVSDEECQTSEVSDTPDCDPSHCLQDVTDVISSNPNEGALAVNVEVSTTANASTAPLQLSSIEKASASEESANSIGCHTSKEAGVHMDDGPLDQIIDHSRKEQEPVTVTDDVHRKETDGSPSVSITDSHIFPLSGILTSERDSSSRILPSTAVTDPLACDVPSKDVKDTHIKQVRERENIFTALEESLNSRMKCPSRPNAVSSDVPANSGTESIQEVFDENSEIPLLVAYDGNECIRDLCSPDSDSLPVLVKEDIPSIGVDGDEDEFEFEVLSDTDADLPCLQNNTIYRMDNSPVGEALSSSDIPEATMQPVSTDGCEDTSNTMPSRGLETSVILEEDDDDEFEFETPEDRESYKVMHLPQSAFSDQPQLVENSRIVPSKITEKVEKELTTNEGLAEEGDSSSVITSPQRADSEIKQSETFDESQKSLSKPSPSQEGDNSSVITTLTCTNSENERSESCDGSLNSSNEPSPSQEGSKLGDLQTSCDSLINEVQCSQPSTLETDDVIKDDVSDKAANSLFKDKSPDKLAAIIEASGTSEKEQPADLSRNESIDETDLHEVRSPVIENGHDTSSEISHGKDAFPQKPICTYQKDELEDSANTDDKDHDSGSNSWQAAASVESLQEETHVCKAESSTCFHGTDENLTVKGISRTPDEPVSENKVQEITFPTDQRRVKPDDVSSKADIPDSDMVAQETADKQNSVINQPDKLVSKSENASSMTNESTASEIAVPKAQVESPQSQLLNQLTLVESQIDLVSRNDGKLLDAEKLETSDHVFNTSVPECEQVAVLPIVESHSGSIQDTECQLQETTDGKSANQHKADSINGSDEDHLEPLTNTESVHDALKNVEIPDSEHDISSDVLQPAEIIKDVDQDARSTASSENATVPYPLSDIEDVDVESEISAIQSTSEPQPTSTNIENAPPISNHTKKMTTFSPSLISTCPVKWAVKFRKRRRRRKNRDPYSIGKKKSQSKKCKSGKTASCSMQLSDVQTSEVMQVHLENTSHENYATIPQKIQEDNSPQQSNGLTSGAKIDCINESDLPEVISNSEKNGASSLLSDDQMSVSTIDFTKDDQSEIKACQTTEDKEITAHSPELRSLTEDDTTETIDDPRRDTSPKHNPTEFSSNSPLVEVPQSLAPQDQPETTPEDLPVEEEIPEIPLEDVDGAQLNSTASGIECKHQSEEVTGTTAIVQPVANKETQPPRLDMTEMTETRPPDDQSTLTEFRPALDSSLQRMQSILQSTGAAYSTITQTCVNDTVKSVNIPGLPTPELGLKSRCIEKPPVSKPGPTTFFGQPRKRSFPEQRIPAPRPMLLPYQVPPRQTVQNPRPHLPPRFLNHVKLNTAQPVQCSELKHLLSVKGVVSGDPKYILPNQQVAADPHQNTQQRGPALTSIVNEQMIAQEQLAALKQQSAERRRGGLRTPTQRPQSDFVTTQSFPHHNEAVGKYPEGLHEQEVYRSTKSQYQNVSNVTSYKDNVRHPSLGSPSAYVRTASGTLLVQMKDDTQKTNTLETYSQPEGIRHMPKSGQLPVSQGVLSPEPVHKGLSLNAMNLNALPYHTPVITARVPSYSGLKEHLIPIYPNQRVQLPSGEIVGDLTLDHRVRHSSDTGSIHKSPSLHMGQDAMLQVLRRLHSKQTDQERPTMFQELSEVNKFGIHQSEINAQGDHQFYGEHPSLRNILIPSMSHREGTSSVISPTSPCLSGPDHSGPNSPCPATLLREVSPQWSRTSVSPFIASVTSRTSTPQTSAMPSVSPGSSRSNSMTFEEDGPLDLTCKGSQKSHIPASAQEGPVPLDLSRTVNSNNVLQRQDLFDGCMQPKDSSAVGLTHLQAGVSSPISGLTYSANTFTEATSKELSTSKSNMESGVQLQGSTAFVTARMEPAQPENVYQLLQTPVSSSGRDSVSSVHSGNSAVNDDHHITQLTRPCVRVEQYQHQTEHSLSNMHTYIDRAKEPLPYMDLSRKGLTCEGPGLVITRTVNSNVPSAAPPTSVYGNQSALANGGIEDRNEPESTPENERPPQENDQICNRVADVADVQNMELGHTTTSATSSSVIQTTAENMHHASVVDSNRNSLTARKSTVQANKESHVVRSEPASNVQTSLSVIMHCPKKRYKLALAASLSDDKTSGSSPQETEELRLSVVPVEAEVATHPRSSSDTTHQLDSKVEKMVIDRDSSIDSSVMRRRRGRPRGSSRMSNTMASEMIIQHCQFCEFKSSSRQELRDHRNEIHFAKHMLLPKSTKKRRKTLNDKELASYVVHQDVDMDSTLVLCCKKLKSQKTVAPNTTGTEIEMNSKEVTASGKPSVRETTAPKAQGINSKPAIRDNLCNSHRGGSRKDCLLHLCQYCQRNFPSQDFLHEHQRTEHPNQYELNKCRLCGYCERTPSLLVMHIHRMHQKQLPSDVCPIVGCQRSFSTVKDLKDHLNDHCIVSHFACRICGVQYQVLSSLKAHLERHKQDLPNLCKVCKLSFKTPGTLLRHQRQRGHFAD